MNVPNSQIWSKYLHHLACDIYKFYKCSVCILCILFNYLLYKINRVRVWQYNFSLIIQYILWPADNLPCASRGRSAISTMQVGGNLGFLIIGLKKYQCGTAGLKPLWYRSRTRKGEAKGYMSAFCMQTHGDARSMTNARSTTGGCPS